MILINGRPADVAAIMNSYPRGSVERDILQIISSSQAKHRYSSIEELQFELRMRREIIAAAEALYRSKLAFAVFRKSRCNPEYWVRQNDGGFQLKRGVSASEAIRDIFINTSLYATECATAMVIVYYKSLVEIMPAEQFDALFSDIYLMNWHRIDPLLREIGQMVRPLDYLPGDRRYVKNPDVDPLTPEWQGENLIDMSSGIFYGHGIGKHNLQTFIDSLNRHRFEGAQQSAYLMDTVGVPNFKNLARIYYQQIT